MKAKTLILVGVAGVAAYLLLFRKPAYGKAGTHPSGTSTGSKPAGASKDWMDYASQGADVATKLFGLGEEIYGAVHGTSGSSAAGAQDPALSYQSVTDKDRWKL